MTRRRERNRDGRRDLARTFAASVHCPDCDSDAEIVEHAPGLYALAVAHDDTCPTYRTMTRGTT